MAVILTSQIHEFREAARHLWNSYMRSNATWDTADDFARVAAILFSECALRRAAVEARPIPIDHGTEVLTEYRSRPLRAVATSCEPRHPGVRILGPPGRLDSA
jgi:hypothetical protein